MVRGFEKLSFGQTLAGSATYISQLILSRNKCKERVKQNEKVIRTTTILFTLIYGEQPMSSFMPLFFRISRVMAIFTACIWFYKVFTFRDTASIYPMRNRVQKRSVTQYYFTESKGYLEGWASKITEYITTPASPTTPKFTWKISVIDTLGRAQGYEQSIILCRDSY